MLYIIILSILLVPIASIITIKGTIVWFPQLLALQFVGGLFFASRFWKLNKFLAIFLAYLIFSYVYVTGASPRTLLCLMIGYAAISVTLSISKIKDLKYVYIALIGMSLLSCTYSILQAFGIDPIFVPITGGKEDVVSFMGSHNQLGAYSAANAFWGVCLMPLAIIPIFLAKCNSALIGLIAGSMVYIWSIYGKKVISILIICCFIALVPWWHFCHKSNQEISERINLWKLSLQQVSHGTIEEHYLNGNKALIKANPLFGFGLGNFFSYSPFSQYKMWDLSKQYKNEVPHYYEHAHNDLLEALYEFGYIGFGIIIFLIISVCYNFFSNPKSHGVVITFSSLVAQSVSSMSIYIFHAPVSLFMFCLTLGLFYAEVTREKQSKIKPITT